MTERKAKAKAKANTGVSPLRFAPVEMTGFGGRASQVNDFWGRISALAFLPFS
jgi:hypothetical protein